jgi:hypothetical protein
MANRYLIDYSLLGGIAPLISKNHFGLWIMATCCMTNEVSRSDYRQLRLGELFERLIARLEVDFYR